MCGSDQEAAGSRGWRGRRCRWRRGRGSACGWPPVSGAMRGCRIAGTALRPAPRRTRCSRGSGAVEDAGGVRDLVDIRGEQVREVIGVVQVAGVSRVGDHGVAGQWLALGPYPHAGGDIPILVPLPVYEQCGNRQPVVGSGSSAEVSSEVRMSTVSALVRWALTSMTYC